MNVDATQTGIVFQYHQVQMIVGISCLVVVFQDVLNQGRYRFQIFQTETSLIRIDYHKLITCLELQPSTQKLFNVELISLIKVCCVLIIGVLRQIVLVRKKRSDTTQLQNTLASIQNRKLIYARKVFATMSSDELKKAIKEILLR